jgi:hypothetical protein
VDAEQSGYVSILLATKALAAGIERAQSLVAVLAALAR